MKTEPDFSRKGKRMLWQLALAFVLIAFPVLMIFFNGTRAVQGIFWKTLDKLQLPLISTTSVRDGAPIFGIYDPEHVFAGDQNFRLQHIYVSWIDPDTSVLQEMLRKITRKERRTPVVTIEPWNGPHDAKTLLADVVAGKYDSNIDLMADLISTGPGPVYLIWGHEMDQDLANRYPWSGQAPAQYVDAFRYVQDRMKTRLKTECTWIWSPVVKSGCERYWPGDDYVDYIGMPVYSYPAWEYSYYGHVRGFRSWYGEKYDLVRRFEKPVIIVELGVTGGSDYQAYWLQEAFETIHTTPAVAMVLFFHAHDTEGAWGEDLDTPDWRTNPQVIAGLVQWSLHGSH